MLSNSITSPQNFKEFEIIVLEQHLKIQWNKVEQEKNRNLRHP
jgi:hypothetical protein